MTDPKKMVFVKEHNDEISKMVRRENARRDKRSMPDLSDSEVDEAVGEMMELVASGSRIRAYQFPTTASPQAPQGPQNIQSRPSPPKVPLVPLSDAFHFNIMPCANGFILNAKQVNEAKSFLFKTEKELMKIFKEMFFEQSKAISEKETR